MSEATAAPADEASAGLLLRRAREAAGLHVAALAVSLKVPVRKLEALEGDRYDLLPDAVFARALASSVCRTLKIDPQPVLDRLPRTATPRLGEHADRINTPFRAPGQGSRATWKEQLLRPVALVVIGLLLGALALVLLPEWNDEAPPVARRPVMPPEAAAVSVAPAESTVPGSDGNRPAAVSQRVPNATTPALPSVGTSAAAPAVAAAAVPAYQAAASTPAATGLVMFKTRAPSWVEVVDARGQTVLRRLMERGEAATASGPLPLSVTVGSAGATEVQVRGQPFDLGPVSRDNVARFEVK